MKLGFYDSGLGGLSVLREFIAKYGTKHEYVYYGDSARAPYGDKSPAELKGFVRQILTHMQEKDVDLVISACNTSSMYLSELDLDDYLFQVISLHEVMKKYFTDKVKDFSNKKIALLATSTTVDSERYKVWHDGIHAIKCPKLVPLVEAGNLAGAKKEWLNHLNEVPAGVNDIIVGCTHYSFLVDDEQRKKYNFIDPATVVVEQFSDSVLSDENFNFDPKPDAEFNTDFYFSKNSEEYSDIAVGLLSNSVN